MGSDNGELRQVLGLLVGPVFVALGLWLAWGSIAAHVRFDGAPRTEAVVTSIDYVKPTLKEDVSAIGMDVRTVSGPTHVAIDLPGSAPDGLSVGDRVTVLYDPAHPGEAVFPSALRWGALLPGLGFTVMGSTAAVTGVMAVARGRRVQRIAAHHQQ